jgi:hypothetical protein
MANDSVNLQGIVSTVPTWDYGTSASLPNNVLTGWGLSAEARSEVLTATAPRPIPVSFSSVVIGVSILGGIAWGEILFGSTVDSCMHVVAGIVALFALQSLYKYCQDRAEYSRTLMHRASVERELKETVPLRIVYCAPILEFSRVRPECLKQLSLNQIVATLESLPSDYRLMTCVRKVKSHFQDYHQLLFDQALQIREGVVKGTPTSKNCKNILVSGELHSLYLSHPGLLRVVMAVFSKILTEGHLNVLHRLDRMLKVQVDHLQTQKQINFKVYSRCEQTVFIPFLRRHIPNFDEVAASEGWLSTDLVEAPEGFMRLCAYLAKPADKISKSDFVPVVTLAHKWKMEPFLARALIQIIEDQMFDCYLSLPYNVFENLQSKIPLDHSIALINAFTKTPRNYKKISKTFHLFVSFCLHVGLKQYPVEMVGPILLSFREERELPCSATRASLDLLSIAITQLGCEQFKPHYLKELIEYYDRFEEYNPGLVFEEYWQLIRKQWAQIRPEAASENAMGVDCYDELLEFINTEEGRAVIEEKFPQRKLPEAMESDLQWHLNEQM